MSTWPRAIDPSPERPLGLSIPQMTLMSELLDAALPLDEAGRRRWLEDLAPEYRDLAPALRQALLPGAAQAAVLQALATPPIFASAAECADVAGRGLQPGARVGPYELIRPLGAGGMAQVWLARRADGAFKRELALKLPMPTRLRADLEQRFARERDILASLEHPHIARFYDAGVDSGGLPYLAMEYVQGQALTTWCDAHRLGIAARLQLFLQVAGAVQYAHERQVIHRDLKPSNILVTESGQVRLLDFGIAKLLEAEEADQTQLTGVHGRALTPDYASPELLRGDPVDARSDIYSLGVLLYEILSGVRPYRLKSAASIGLLEQAIATLEVKKPSTQLEQQALGARDSTQEQLARQLRGDLDAIALKALAKDPAQRYPSAAALAEDLRRHLKREPITAQPARLTYRVRKFVLRNTTVVAVSAMAGAAILATLGYTLHRETQTRARAAPDRLTNSAPNAVSTVIPTADKSIAVLPFLDLSEKKDQEYFSDGLSEELIDLLSQTQELQVIARTSSFYFKGKQVTIAEIARTLGVSHVLEGSVRRAGNTVRVSAQLIRTDSGVNLWSQTYDRDVKDIFKVQDEIASAVVGALKLKLLPASQAQNPDRSDIPEAYNQYLLGKQFALRGNLENYQRAAAAFRAATALDPRYAAAYVGVSLAETQLAIYTLDAAGFERGRTAAETALALAPQFVDAYLARAFVRLELLDFAGHRADQEKSIAIAPNDSGAQRDYGFMLAMYRRFPEAVVATHKAIELDPLNTGAWVNLGLFLTAGADFPAARQAFERALAISPDSDWVQYNLGRLDLLEGRLAQASAEFSRYGEEEENYHHYSQALIEHSRGHERESQQALALLIAKHADDSAYWIASVYAWRGEHDQAFEWLERARRQREGSLAEISFDPVLGGLRGDPRYAALLKKLKLSE
jgi:serine/threonine protein kinase/Tfp pilus assembly protein PilF